MDLLLLTNVDKITFKYVCIFTVLSSYGIQWPRACCFTQRNEAFCVVFIFLTKDNDVYLFV